MQTQSFQFTRPSLRHFAVAGLAGSAAEVLWIALFCAATGTSSVGVLRQVGATAFAGSADAAWAPVAGIVVHFLLGVLIAVAFGIVVRNGLLRRVGARTQFAAALVALTTIWAINFFVLLPVLNPAFVTIVPLSASFASKLLFGIAMATSLGFAPATLQRVSALSASRGAVVRPSVELPSGR